MKANQISAEFQDFTITANKRNEMLSIFVYPSEKVNIIVYRNF